MTSLVRSFRMNWKITFLNRKKVDTGTGKKQRPGGVPVLVLVVTTFIITGTEYNFALFC